MNRRELRMLWTLIGWPLFMIVFALLVAAVSPSRLLAIANGVSAGVWIPPLISGLMTWSTLRRTLRTLAQVRANSAISEAIEAAGGKG